MVKPGLNTKAIEEYVEAVRKAAFAEGYAAAKAELYRKEVLSANGEEQQSDTPQDDNFVPRNLERTEIWRESWWRSI